MAIDRWSPPVELSKKETLIVRHLKRVRTLLVFLRLHRHEIIDEGFQDELAALYRNTGAGKAPIAPGLMAMATLVQGYLNVSDAELVRLTALDASVQMVLDCVGSIENLFSQGAFADFRQRFVRADMDRRLLERTIELAKRTKEFDWKKLPKSLRVAMDSAPLEGAGRVEDTFNLLAHAARKVAACAADLLNWPITRVCEKAGCPLLVESSIKKALDLDWGDDDAKHEGLNRLLEELDSLDAWLKRELAEELKKPPLDVHVATLEKIRDQNLEPDPGGGGQRIREGVAPDRRISVEEPDMRHGRKSKTKAFNGYKQHVTTDLDTDLILSAALLPANRQEAEAAEPLLHDIEQQGFTIGAMYIDRGYVSSVAINQRVAAGAELVCKPHDRSLGDRFSKSDFGIDMRARTIACPGGQTKSFALGQKVQFDGAICAKCPVRENCTTSKNGRAVQIALDEPLQHRLRKQLLTKAGRSKLRQRTKVEHRLAHLVRRTGRRARYVGVRKNLFAVRRGAAIQNLETIRRRAAG
jgi:hypothetical protein